MVSAPPNDRLRRSIPDGDDRGRPTGAECRLVSCESPKVVGGSVLAPTGGEATGLMGRRAILGWMFGLALTASVAPAYGQSAPSPPGASVAGSGVMATDRRVRRRRNTSPAPSRAEVSRVLRGEPAPIPDREFRPLPLAEPRTRVVPNFWRQSSPEQGVTFDRELGARLREGPSRPAVGASLRVPFSF